MATALSIACASLVAEIVPTENIDSVKQDRQEMQQHNKLLADFSKMMSLDTKEARIVDGEMRAILPSKTDFDPKHTNSTYRLYICRHNTYSPNTNAELNMAVSVTSMW